MLILDIIQTLESFAPLAYQESYDNSGLLTGNKNTNCTGVLCSLDVTVDVIEEAKKKNCNLIVAHHPIIFSGLKKLTGSNYVEQTIISAIKNEIAIYACHTNLDNVFHGVNHQMANQLGLMNRKILQPKTNILSKLFVFVPKNDADKVKEAIFKAGAGEIANYSECSFSTEGVGTFKGNGNSNPTIGKPLVRELVDEVKIEVIFPSYLQQNVVEQMKLAHPYEEVAYDIVPLSNQNQEVGSGIVGELPKSMTELEFLSFVKSKFDLKVIKHTPLLQKPIKKVAVCGGSGSFLIKNAIAAQADIYISADIKYHEYFDAEQKIVVADIGHWESEQYTIELLIEIIRAKTPTFAVLKSEVNTNPVSYFID
jgi:dinuclear metal center YbgI/SA1388 family protein